jgi:predicted nucleic acid-binding Zn ribbon protein
MEEEIALCKYCTNEIEEGEDYCDDWCEKGAKQDAYGE